MWYSAGVFLCFLLIFSLFQSVQVIVFFKMLVVIYTIVFFGRFSFGRLTAVNIKGVFNTTMETKYEKDAPDGMQLLIVMLFL